MNKFTRLGPWIALIFCVVSSGATAAWSVSNETPAYHLLSTLDLLKVSSKKGVRVSAPKKRKDGSYTRRVVMKSKSPADVYSARGLGIVQAVLTNPAKLPLKKFDLLYDGEDRLLAVFPVLPKKLFRKKLTREEWVAITPKVIDVTPFYFDVPRSGSSGEMKHWRLFAATHRGYRKMVDDFAKEYFEPVMKLYPEFLGHVLPYRLHEMDKETGKWRAYAFSPEAFQEKPPTDRMVATFTPLEFNKIFRSQMKGIIRTVIPRFPSVYVLGTIKPAEKVYLARLLNDFDLKPDAKIMVVGPGTGIDVWVASTQTKGPVYTIGINPLEVANTRATAQIAGFKLHGLVGDNITDEKGVPRFPGETFDAVFWNMPWYNPKTDDGDLRAGLEASWDGDVGGVALKGFARGLPKILRPKGVCMFWNYSHFDSAGRDEVVEIMIKAAGTKDIFNVSVLAFIKPTRKWKKSYYQGKLFTLRFMK